MVLHCCPSISIPIPKPLLTLTHRIKPKPKFSCFVVPNIGVDDIAQLAHNKVLVAAAASAAIGQLSKPFTSVLLYGKDFDFKTAFQAGGFPSTHSSSVVAAATSLAFERGFSDSIFGVTLVYAGLVMYDAQGVRREVGNHAKVLNAILAKRRVNSVVTEDRDNLIDSPEDYEVLDQIRLKESIGHTEVEVVAGALLGFLVSLAVYSIVM
ncbi:Acid phosphatase/vanadium-dependent haloperoxidase-related protein, putative isoform 2 [Hibiscus syriacus]|uniref:Acid phosphatase/vanadium-dependent haloperoxidase-related protein, putative isoform 2 n=1 Tax=Hibiscus syriacus TaxID=106335 RepID=A0A6A3BFS3_HIBSY|nr:Acid phosphatase/vanadium-dependent haloperoxidase-related protein, putative isoform 2 [Hibiscus syriacus]